MENVLALISGFHFSNDAFSLLVFVLCAFYLIKIFHQAYKDQLLDWSDILTVHGPSNKVSLKKVMQLAGCFVSTWVIIHLTVFVKITWDMYRAYLSYIAGSEAYSKYLAAKHSKIITDDKPKKSTVKKES